MATFLDGPFKGDSGVAESVEMGVEMVKVEWGKPPGPKKNLEGR